MAKRKLFDEMMGAIAAMKQHREGTVRLCSSKVKGKVEDTCRKPNQAAEVSGTTRARTH
jgi:hypothetical protein